MRGIGLHVRLTGTLVDLIQKAIRLQLPFFQCFFLEQATGRAPKPTQYEIATFLALRREHFTKMYLHASYWINLASVHRTSHRALRHEFEWAKRLEFTDIIFHPGSAKGAKARRSGIEAVARVLNSIFKSESEMGIVMENTAHGNLSVGGDLQDFALLISLLDQPERLSFCIDTAHAHSFGYDVMSEKGQQDFIDLLASTIGIHTIELIHLNDTREVCGSKMDRHYAVGRGVLGIEGLKRFVLYPRLSTIPLLLELPEMPEEEEKNALDEVRSWHVNS